MGTQLTLESRQYFSIPVSRTKPLPPHHSIAFPVIFWAMTEEYHLLISFIRGTRRRKLTWPEQPEQGMDDPLPVLHQLIVSKERTRMADL